MPESPQLLLLGGGNMGRSLIGGLLRHGWEAGRIAVSDPDPQSHQVLSEEFGLQRRFYENSLAYDEMRPEVLLFAVKPGQMPATATDLAPWMVAERPLLMTIAAGVRADDLARWTGGHCPVVRVMPNTPALVGAGMSVLYARDEASEEQRELAERIMRSVGQTLWVDDEGLMDAATAVSGSGPAYFFAFMQAMIEGACGMGLSEEQARMLVLETARGAQELASASEESLRTLCQQVTSKGGTTEAALGVMESNGFREIVAEALEAARRRAREIGDENSRA